MRRNPRPERKELVDPPAILTSVSVALWVFLKKKEILDQE